VPRVQKVLCREMIKGIRRRAKGMRAAGTAADETIARAAP
jgi:hypothetical protein